MKIWGKSILGGGDAKLKSQELEKDLAYKEPIEVLSAGSGEAKRQRTNLS